MIRPVCPQNIWFDLLATTQIGLPEIIFDIRLCQHFLFRCYQYWSSTEFHNMLKLLIHSKTTQMILVKKRKWFKVKVKKAAGFTSFDPSSIRHRILQ